jgi:outer membrane receptor protein involved in Fe transport
MKKASRIARAAPLSRTASIVALVCAGWMLTPAFAGPDPAGPAGPAPSAAGEVAPAHSGDLEEIVVTAEKRDSTVQATPISMTALSSADLAEQNIGSVQDLVGAVPGISLRTAGPGQTEYEMRGLGSSGGSVATVGFYIDETPLSASAVALNGRTVIDADLYDLNHTEILRGPQGTLYGAGSMGGTIKLVTKHPGRLGRGGCLADHGREHQWPRQPDVESADRRHRRIPIRHHGQVHQRLDRPQGDRPRPVSLSDEFRELRRLLLHPRQR